jgi:hypothetical protein
MDTMIDERAAVRASLERAGVTEVSERDIDLVLVLAVPIAE